MTWLSALKRWCLPSRSRGATCESSEDVSRLRGVLEQEQRAIAQNLEGLFQAYDARVREMAERLHGMSDGEIEAESEQLAQAQDELKQLTRRLETAVKSRQQLERELGEWQDRSTEDGPMHADHPKTRAEIVRSEIALREAYRKPLMTSAPTVLYAGSMTAKQEDGSGTDVVVQDDVVADEGGPVMKEVSSEQVIEIIREATKEAERWHATVQDQYGQDALDQMHHVRDLHALLKQIDRNQGIRRDRFAMAVRMRG